MPVPQDALEELVGSSRRWSEPVQDASPAVAEPGSDVDHVDGLSRIEDREGALESCITLQKLSGDRMRGEAGRQPVDEVVVTYESLLASYHEYRTLALRVAGPPTDDGHP